MRGGRWGERIFVFLICVFISVPALAKVNKKEIRAKISGISVPFIKNEGQVNKKVCFYAHTFGGTVFVTQKGKLVYLLPKIKKATNKKQEIKGWVITERLLGAKVKEVKGIKRAVTKVNYFIGRDKNRWKKDISSYDEISLGEIYKGIELRLRAYGNNVEKIFKIEPRGRVEDILLTIRGGRGLKVTRDGRLEVRTLLGNIRVLQSH